MRAYIQQRYVQACEEKQQSSMHIYIHTYTYKIRKNDINFIDAQGKKPHKEGKSASAVLKSVATHILHEIYHSHRNHSNPHQ